MHGARGGDPTENGDEPPYFYPAVEHDPGIAALKGHWENQGWRPFSLPLGVKLDQASPVTSPCIKCKTCGGYPCLLRAKCDARTIAVEPLLDLLGEFDMVLVMTVEPGFGGQAFIEGTLPKLRRLRKAVQEAGTGTWIQVDGGVSRDTIARIARAGADTFVAGSAVYGANDVAAEIATLRELAEAPIQA